MPTITWQITTLLFRNVRSQKEPMVEAEEWTGARERAGANSFAYADGLAITVKGKKFEDI